MTTSASNARRKTPIVGGLPDVPGIVAAMRLTPGLGIHLRGLADELLVNDFPGATISRAEREMLATAVSAANDCFFCMDSHGGASRRPCSSATGDDGSRAAHRRRSSSGRPTASTPRCRRCSTSRGPSGGEPRDLTADDVAAAQAAGATDADVQLAVLIAAGVLDVQPDGRRVPRPDAAGRRRLSRARAARSPSRLQRPARGRPAALTLPDLRTHGRSTGRSVIRRSPRAPRSRAPAGWQDPLGPMAGGRRHRPSPTVRQRACSRAHALIGRYATRPGSPLIRRPSVSDARSRRNNRCPSGCPSARPRSSVR